MKPVETSRRAPADGIVSASTLARKESLMLKTLTVGAIALSVIGAPTIAASPAFAAESARVVQAAAMATSITVNDFDLSDDALTGYLSSDRRELLYISVNDENGRYLIDFFPGGDFSIATAKILALKPALKAGDILNIHTGTGYSGPTAHVTVTGENPNPYQPEEPQPGDFTVDAFTETDSTVTGKAGPGVVHVRLSSPSGTLGVARVAADKTFEIELRNDSIDNHRAGTQLSLAWLDASGRSVAPSTALIVQAAPAAAAPVVNPLEVGGDTLTGTAGENSSYVYIRRNGSGGTAVKTSPGQPFSIDLSDTLGSAIHPGDKILVIGLNAAYTWGGTTEITIPGDPDPLAAPTFDEFAIGDGWLNANVSVSTRTIDVQLDGETLANGIPVRDGAVALSSSGFGALSPGMTITVIPFDGDGNPGPAGHLTLK